MTLPKQIPSAARVIASTTLIVLALLAFKSCTVPPQAETNIRTFTMPAMFLTCFKYSLRDNETFSGWDIYQPMIFDISGSNIIVSNVTVHLKGWCAG